MSEQHNMKSIWFFVGLTLLVMGALVFSAGVFMVFSPPKTQTVLSHLHPDLWWGGLMMASGALFLIFEAKRAKKQKGS